MKKILVLPILIALILISKSAFTQDSERSLFHFGLKAAPAVSWFTPGDKKLSNDGSKFGFGYGLTTEFGITKNYAISTGLEVVNAGGKLVFPSTTDSTYYSVLDENSIIEKYDTFLLKERTYRLRYVNIPLLLKLKTNPIGSMTYFGQFGVDASIKWKAMADDDGNFLGQQTTTRNDVDISNDIGFLRLALNVGLGAEYNLSGSTSLVFSVNYNNGFTNALQKKSENIRLYKVGRKSNEFEQKAVFNYVSVTVGILF